MHKLMWLHWWVSTEANSYHAHHIVWSKGEMPDSNSSERLAHETKLHQDDLIIMPLDTLLLNLVSIIWLHLVSRATPPILSIRLNDHQSMNS